VANNVGKWVAALIVIVATVAAIYFSATRELWSYLTPTPAPRAPVPAIPIRATVVKRQDVPVFLSGLGTVQAFNSVLVKSRVDGQIIKINFIEGQNVRAGDVLVEIDPAPYQAALGQAQATKLKDEAQLENARLDLERFGRLATTNAVSKQQLDTARALVAQLAATIKADQAMIDMAQTQLDYVHL
jgi:multidrug efflux system membrane fusion protein